MEREIISSISDIFLAREAAVARLARFLAPLHKRRWWAVLRCGKCIWGNGFCSFMRIRLQQGNWSESHADAFSLESAGLWKAELSIRCISSVRGLTNFGSMQNCGNDKTSKKKHQAMCFRAARLKPLSIAQSSQSSSLRVSKWHYQEMKPTVFHQGIICPTNFMHELEKQVMLCQCQTIWGEFNKRRTNVLLQENPFSSCVRTEIRKVSKKPVLGSAS